jgi:hypothetical protein
MNILGWNGMEREKESKKDETIDIFIILTTNLHHIFVKINFTTSSRPDIMRLLLSSLDEGASASICRRKADENLRRCGCSIGPTRDLGICL